MAMRMIRKVRAHDWAQVWFIAHSTELIDQPADDLAELEIPHAFVKAERDPDPTAAVQVCQVQTLINRQITPAPDGNGKPYRRAVVFIDEAHHVKAATYLQVRDRLRASYDLIYFLLLTATPYRTDGRGLADVAEALIEATTPRELVDAGYLVNPLYWSNPPPDEDADALADRPRLVGDIVDTWLKRADGLPTIGRAINVAHSQRIVERFRAAGVRAEHIDGTMGQAQRANLYARLAIGGRASGHPQAIDVLCTGGTLLEEGFDGRKSYRHVLADRSLWLGHSYPPRYRPLCCLGDWSPTKARGAWIQRIGRVTRTHWPSEVAAMSKQGIDSDVKTRALVLCHSGNLERHRFLLDHQGFTLDGDQVGATKPGSAPRLRARAPLSCPVCLAVSSAGTPACPACGCPLAAGEPDIPEEDAATELVERKWDPKATLPPTTEIMTRALRKFYAQMRSANAERAAVGAPAYKPGWARVKFKLAFGDWPPDHMDRAIAAEFGFRDRS